MLSTNEQFELAWEEHFSKRDAQHERYYREIQDAADALAIDHDHKQTCQAAHQMGLLRWGEHGEILDDYHAYWERLETWVMNQPEQLWI